MSSEEYQKLELDILKDAFRRMSKCCIEKCLFSNYIEPYLSKGEDMCLKRCVSKYMELHSRIGEQMNNIEIEEQKMRGTYPNTDLKTSNNIINKK
ncbi:hypothetical protein HZS_3861 [Henneguya salminicola]|nr:hypothetical protein HZS_3861 [Henneguya salminicola]